MVFTPGKVILCGEHAVVYGKQALVASIGLGVRARVVKISNNFGDSKNLVKNAIKIAGGDENISVEIESELPVGSGLGSSAAVAAATIKVVREYLGKSIEKDELFKLTMECEKIAHGNASGVDPAAVVYRGLISYVKGQGIERLEVKGPIKLLLVDSGKPTESTKEMVELVAKNPEREEIVEEIGGLVGKVRRELESGGRISELLDQNGKLLESLGVVGKGARKLSDELRSLGVSVKITGAGGIRAGSGMMIVMGGDLAKMKRLLKNKHINYFETEIGGQ